MNRVFAVAVLMALAAPASAISQEGGDIKQPPDANLAKEPPYEEKLARLAEVIGSVHYLRTLCGDSSMTWRTAMEDLIAAENPAPDRKAKLVARFNHGYRAFDGVHKQCSQSAGVALARYMDEGEKLSAEIASRYGN